MNVAVSVVDPGLFLKGGGIIFSKQKRWKVVKNSAFFFWVRHTGLTSPRVLCHFPFFGELLHEHMGATWGFPIGPRPPLVQKGGGGGGHAPEMTPLDPTMVLKAQKQEKNLSSPSGIAEPRIYVYTPQNVKSLKKYMIF